MRRTARFRAPTAVRARGRRLCVCAALGPTLGTKTNTPPNKQTNKQTPPLLGVGRATVLRKLEDDARSIISFPPTDCKPPSSSNQPKNRQQTVIINLAKPYPDLTHVPRGIHLLGWTRAWLRNWRTRHEWHARAAVTKSPRIYPKSLPALARAHAARARTELRPNSRSARSAVRYHQALGSRRTSAQCNSEPASPPHGRRAGFGALRCCCSYDDPSALAEARRMLF